ncbi:MAG: DUF115 domain-containing protein [Treponema sp.]|nr:DUF115 domain-containing protein [Treponema sp.]
MDETDSPCLVPARQGMTVRYRKKNLYSLYNPAAVIERTIALNTILPGTLVLCVSPCLCYGIPSLLKKLPERCIALGIEVDDALYRFSQPYAAACTEADNRFCLVAPDDIAALPVRLNTRHACLSDGTRLPPPGTIRRVLTITFSAGAAIHADYYNAVYAACTTAVGQFWKNRVTLTKLGRRFSRNLIRNLADIPDTVSARSLFGTVDRPILVCGAGPSLITTAIALKKNRAAFFVLAVDAALPVLLKMELTPDALVCEEAQGAIADAFFGCRSRRIPVFAGITSWNGISRATGGSTAYFASRYSDTAFFEHLEQLRLLPPVLPPLGSVGLTATLLALSLRQNDTVCVFVTGLDFSHPVGRTHARGAPATVRDISTAGRLRPVGNYAAACAYGAALVPGIDGKLTVTTKVLSGYAAEFRGVFAQEKNLFDARHHGLEIGLARRDITATGGSCPPKAAPSPEITRIASKATAVSDGSHTATAVPPQQEQAKPLHPPLATRAALTSWYRTELAALKTARALLSGETTIHRTQRDTQLARLLSDREYLYLHFPDGYRYSPDRSFLKRIRAELDFFIKDFKQALRRLTAAP